LSFLVSAVVFYLANSLCELVFITHIKIYVRDKIRIVILFEHLSLLDFNC